MRDEEKTREQLLEEIYALKARVREIDETEDERLLAIEDLRLSEEKFRLIAENLPGAVYLCRNDENATILYLGAGIEQITGWTRRDFISDKVRLSDLYHPDDATSVHDEVARALLESRPYHVRYRIRKRDSAIAWIEEWGSAVFEAGEAKMFEGFLADVTSQVEAESAKLRSERIYEALFRQSNDGIVIHDMTGKPVSVNDRMLSMLGLTENEMRTRDVRTLIRVPDGVDMSKMMTDLVSKGHLITELTILSNSGLEIPVEISASLVHIAGETLMMNLVRDVSERHRAAEKLREENAFKQALINNAGIGIAVCRETAAAPFLVFNLWNPKMEEISGYTLEEINSRSWLEALFPDPDAAAAAVASLQEQGESRSGKSGEIEIVAKDGSRRAVALSTSSIQGADGKRYWLAVLNDLTEKKKSESEQRKLQFQVQQAQKMESLGILAGGIAHDFNNLLMGILGNADLAVRDIPHISPARECIIDIETAARRAADLCRQMLAYSGKGRFVVESMDLSEAVREMAHLLDASISKRATLKLDLSKTLPSVRADATQVRQVIMNLITNASESLGDERGIVSVCTGTMTCDRGYLSSTFIDERLPEGEYVFLEVSDTGCGMDRETMKRIFDPFFTTKFTGRGLGLSAVMGIVRGHGGAIKIYSEVGRGSTFKVLFPAVKGKPGRKAFERKPAVPVTMSGKVLLADDEDTIRTVTGRMLEKIGFSVALAEDGEEALRLFSGDPDGFALVILDLTMPNMDGEECFRELRRLKNDVKVILSSGYNEQEVTQRFAGKGLAGFIQKPYVLDSLISKIRETIAPKGNS